MANNIKGITIEIGGDTTGLDKALKGVNSEIRSTQNELREVDKALKLDPTNVDLLEQKQRALAKSVEATSDKLDTLKEAQKQALEQLEKGEIAQEQYDALTREIVKTEDALKKAKQASEEFNVTTEKLSAQLDGVSTKAGAVAEKTKALSGAAAGLLTAMGAAAYQSAQMADDLNTLSKQTGITTEDLQKMSYASDLVDVSVDTITGSMSKLKKSMVSTSSSTQEAFAKIGVATTDANGQLRNSTDVFYDVLDGLSKVGNETERDTLAMAIFGKGADELAGIIDDGGAALKELGDEAESLGIILDQDTLDSLNAVNDSIDKLKAKAQGNIAKAGASAMEALLPVFESVIEKLSAVLEFIGSLDSDTIKIIATIALVIAAISPIAGLIAGITGAISTLVTWFPTIQAGFTAVTTFAAANPILIILAAVAALAVAVATNWDKIKPIIDAAKEKVEKLKDHFLGIWESIQQTVKDKVNTIIGYVNNAIESVNTLINKLNNSTLGKVFNLNVGNIGKLPMMANGGILSSGSAIVGEAGAELLSMSNGKAVVQPLTNSTTINNISNVPTSPIELVVKLDSAIVARELYEANRWEGTRRGEAAFVR